MTRTASVTRDTYETQIALNLDLDNFAPSKIATGVGFFDHMLAQIARHANITLNITAKGDYHIDDHHTVEDVGIALGMALRESLGDKKGMARFAHAYVPLDEALSRAVIDFSGRPGLHYFVAFPVEKIGQFDVQLIHEFFQGLVNHAPLTLHLDSLRGENAHHIAESLFKAFARALRAAIVVDETSLDIPSTKGLL